MRTKLILTFVFGLFSLFITAQTTVYHSFPDSNAVWNVTFGGLENTSCFQFSYTMSSDTSVNGTVYHKLIKKEVTYPPDPYGDACIFCCPSLPVTSYAGAIRQDTAERKIYFLQPNTPTDTLLYDFTLNVGDTLKTYVSAFCSPGVVVTSIDSILIGAEYHKRWTVNRDGCLFEGNIIEGIGSAFGLLEPMINFEWGGNLDCFSQNNQMVYPTFSTTTGCPLITSISNPKFSINHISFYPNPSNGIFKIKSIGKVSKIEIYDLLGKIIYESDFQSEIDLSSEGEGVYFIRLILENTTIESYKLIIIN